MALRVSSLCVELIKYVVWILVLFQVLCYVGCADGSILSFRGLGLSSFFGRVTKCPEGSISVAGSSDVSDCECIVGRHRVEGVCVFCGENTFKDAVGDTGCSACPANSVSLPGSVGVEACLCSPGFGLVGVVGAVDMCQACVAGTYKDYVSNVECLVCPVYSSSLSSGSTSAGDCVCNAGYEGGVLDASGTGCTACGFGTYKSVGDSECQVCPSFTTTSAEASGALSDCICVEGYTAPNAGEACVECGAGHYKDFVGNSDCVVCPSDSSSPSGSTSISSCECNAGFTTDGSSCVECGTGTFKTSVSNDPCTSCLEHSSSPVGSDAVEDCVCVAGYHGPSSACTACAHDFYCPGDGVAYPCPGNSSSPALSTTEDACVCDSGYKKDGDD